MLKKLALSLSLFGLTSATIASGGEFDCSTVTAIPYEECEALVAVYNSTGGDHWWHEEGWLTTNKVCDWSGIICSNGHVSELYLDYNQLTGSIPSELANLTKLEYLNLEDNELRGSIPTELGNLTNLKWLSLSSNRITGSIPTELGNLTKLEYLDLGGNGLTGSIPTELGNLTKLEYLDLAYNALTGSIPTELGNLSELEYLNLKSSLHFYDKKLTGSIPTEFGNLTKLEYLDLAYNDLTGSIPTEFGNLTKLKHLDLNANDLTGSIPTEFGNLTKLESLNLEYNELTSSIPTEFGNLTKLESLNMEDNELTGSIPSELGNLTNLKRLSLSINRLTGSIPSELGNLTNLENLFLNSNQLTGSIPSELGNLTKLERLWLHYNDLTGSIPSELGNLTNLLYLWLDGNELCGEIPVELKKLSNIPPYSQERIYLRLDYNHLTASKPGLIAWLNRRDPYWKRQTPCSGKLQFSSATYSVNGEQATITVSRIGNTEGAVSVEYATSDDTATAPDDYTQTTGTLNWADNDNADKTFTVALIDDSQQENDETFIVSLGNLTGGAELGTPDTAIVTIMDNETFGCKKVTEIPKKECQTLITFYNSTDGENWEDNTGWNVTNSPCDWHGVSCQDGRVTRLALENNNLKGSISKKLTKLKKLTQLDLNDNCLETKVSKKLKKWLNKLNPGWDETQGTDCLY